MEFVRKNALFFGFDLLIQIFHIINRLLFEINVVFCSCCCCECSCRVLISSSIAIYHFADIIHLICNHRSTNRLIDSLLPHVLLLIYCLFAFPFSCIFLFCLLFYFSLSVRFRFICFQRPGEKIIWRRFGRFVFTLLELSFHFFYLYFVFNFHSMSFSLSLSSWIFRIFFYFDFSFGTL